MNRRHYMLWSAVFVALYVVVGGGAPWDIHTPSTADSGVFPQVCRVVMPEDLDR